MGKVGSTSVYESLKKTYADDKQYYVEHLHMQNDMNLSKRENLIKKEIFKNKKKSKHLYESLFWKPLLFKKTSRKHSNSIKWITIIREPVKRNISIFFQWIEFKETFDFYSFKSRNPNYPFSIQTPKDDLSELIEYFLNVFDHSLHIKWLEEELKEVLGVDYKAIDFNLNKNYYIGDTRNAKSNLLILKLETLNKTFKPSMNEFLSIDSELLNKNKAESKVIGKVYSDFTNQIKFQKKYLDTIYDTDYMNKFYSSEELNSFYNRWS
jgi:hypothetical protein